MQKKKFSENRPAAIAILILVAVLAVPLLGGLRLSLDYNSAARSFAKAVTTPDRHGNDLMTDTQEVINYATAILEEGRKLAEDAGLNIGTHSEKLGSAIEKTQNAKSAAERYVAYEALISEVKQFYYAVRSVSSASLEQSKSGIDSCESRIERSYRPAYSEFMNRRSNMVTGFPAALIADFFGIGG